ncbi:MAG: cytochrome b/b6 domain-containing protein [Eggerthellaceae bacterium]|nr:cytochrome b/b6 domain-containing protein [Eggerthellaceae bacterium]
MAHLAHYREAHPLPFVVTHWVNLISMVLLILTGFSIHYPFVPGFMAICRGLHLFCAFVLVLNCITRIVLSFFVKSAPTEGTREEVTDIKTWLPQADNRHQLGAWLKFYFFVKKDFPLSAKLSGLQKGSYIAIAVLIFVMAYTGFSLWSVTMEAPFFAAGVNLVGGIMNMRVIHYFLMYAFICFMMLHIYLANVEGFDQTKLIFLRKEEGGLVYDPARHTIVGEDDLHDK